MAIPVKNLTVSITMVVSIVLAMGTTIFNMMQDSNDKSIIQLKEDITELKDGNVVLHRRITDVSERQRSLETNLAGYNAKLDIVQINISEIKSDIKDLSRIDFATAIRSALRDLNKE